MMDVLTEQDGKFYATARARIVEHVDDLPREMASEINKDALNPSFLWIAGRYVQAGRPNKNGHYWTFDDLQAGEASVRYTPMNVLHKWDKPVGVFVETKIVHREDRDSGSDTMLPEIQALGALWSANFPQIAQMARMAHAADELWYSMECVAESKQCLSCERVFPYVAQAHETCEHLAASASAPRRFINPTFLGGALIFPPEKPAWPEADVLSVARELTQAYANRGEQEWSAGSWEQMMNAVVSLGS